MLDEEVAKAWDVGLLVFISGINMCGLEKEKKGQRANRC